MKHLCIFMFSALLCFFPCQAYVLSAHFPLADDLVEGIDDNFNEDKERNKHEIDENKNEDDEKGENEEGNGKEDEEGEDNAAPADSILLFRDYVSNLSLNGQQAVFCEDNNFFLLTAPLTLKNKNVEFIVSFTTPDHLHFRLLIDGKACRPVDTVSFEDFNCHEAHTLQVYSAEKDSILAESQLFFTFLPLVEVDVNTDECGYDFFTKGTLRLSDADQHLVLSPSYHAAFRYRGASSKSSPKKSFAVKIYDDEDEKTDVSFLGMRSDNNWILDALSTDESNLRNRVSMDIWNAFAAKPQHQEYEDKEVFTGTHGKYVEVILNGNYHGIYCLSEKIDRKQLRLKKYQEEIVGEEGEVIQEKAIRGTLYKTLNWNHEVLFRPLSTLYDYSNQSETWSGYEIKYPDPDDGEEITWEPLIDNIRFVISTDDEAFAGDFDEYFDRPMVYDYYLFMNVILACDNYGKNMYYYHYNIHSTKKHPHRIGLAVWDLDATFGRDANKILKEPELDLTEISHPATYYNRMKEIPFFDWENMLCLRYKEMRETVFHPDSLIARFNDYENLFSDSHADMREQQRWPSLYPNGMHKEAAYIKDWIAERAGFLDETYNYIPPEPVDAVSTILLQKPEAICPAKKQIYDLSGRKVQQLHRGIYIVNGKKVINL